MWFNGGGEMNSSLNMNSNVNSTMNSSLVMNPNFMNPMVPNFNQSNSHDVFDFSLHSSSMQQGTESASSAVPVSTIFSVKSIETAESKHKQMDFFSFIFQLSIV